MQMRDALGPIYHDESFAHLFPQNGRPVEAPWRLALITVMQFAEELPDREAAVWRVVISLVQPGRTRREVLGLSNLPNPEKGRGQEHVGEAEDS